MNIRQILSRCIHILDGAMVTLIQRHKLVEVQFRGERFKNVVKPQIALNIAPKYGLSTVFYMKDTSQNHYALANRLNLETSKKYIKSVAGEYQAISEKSSENNSKLVSLSEARENAFKIDWNNFDAVKPKTMGRVLLDDIKIEEIIPYINWKLFFHSWNLLPKFHTVTNVSMCGHCQAQWLAHFNEDERERAQEASKLYEDAVNMLKKFIDLDVDYIKAVLGFYEAYSENDTIFIDGKPFPMLRQQKKSDENEYLCIADFIAPKSSGKRDFIGVFAVTGGAGSDYLIRKYENEGDEYSALLMKSLLDRLAEAVTEWLHEKVRREYWAYAPDEKLSASEMFSVKYRGIRPAVGYPSIPDQSVNFALHEMLRSGEIGVLLTENGVMYPNASVSGFFLAHPESTYFAVGEISEEQLNDYAARRARETKDIRRFIGKFIMKSESDSLYKKMTIYEKFWK